MSFKIGEVVIYRPAGGEGKLHEYVPGSSAAHAGSECEIITGLIPFPLWPEHSGHRIRFSDGKTAQTHPRNLQKRSDPGRQKHLDGCKPYDKSFNDLMNELGHREVETREKSHG